ncbi:hypothetical protein V6N13_088401 [Hibiscus sabdariffa]
MECNKFALLLVAMAVVLLVTVSPTVMAARYKDMPFSIITHDGIRKPDENCLSNGSICLPWNPEQCCSGKCVFAGTVGMCI